MCARSVTKQNCQLKSRLAATSVLFECSENATKPINSKLALLMIAPPLFSSIV